MKKLLSLLATLFLGSFAFTYSFAQIGFASDTPPEINYNFEEDEDEGPPSLGGVEEKTYTLTYTAGTVGTITGTTPQIVQSGKDGAYVTAKANTGYTFTKWSDGKTANPRKDTNVKANISVTAQFTKNTSTPNPDPDPDPKGPTDLSKTGPETYVFLLLGLLLSLGVRRAQTNNNNR